MSTGSKKRIIAEVVEPPLDGIFTINMDKNEFAWTFEESRMNLFGGAFGLGLAKAVIHGINHPWAKDASESGSLPIVEDENFIVIEERYAIVLRTKVKCHPHRNGTQTTPCEPS